jgi:hypothetical protein
VLGIPSSAIIVVNTIKISDTMAPNNSTLIRHFKSRAGAATKRELTMSTWLASLTNLVAPIAPTQLDTFRQHWLEVKKYYLNEKGAHNLF